MIHYVCIATQSKLYFPYLKKLIPDLVVLGMGMKWSGFIMKYELLVDYLKTLNDDDIICVIDAYDVLPTKYIVDLEKQFIKFSKKNPNVKMIVGYDKPDNYVIDKLGDYIFETHNNCRLNAGQYIGYVKNIKKIIENIMNETFKDDQIEITKYANKHQEQVFIDTERIFFLVKTNILQQVLLSNYKSSFIHANSNGLLEDFLMEHHNIFINSKIRMNNFIINFKDLTHKINMYFNYILNNFLLNNIKFINFDELCLKINNYFKFLEYNATTER
jgi:hypothetical protein